MTVRSGAAKRTDAILRVRFQVLEARFTAENLLVQPPVDDALPKAPLLSQLRRRNPLLLSPLVDGLWREPQIRGDLLDGQNLVVERASARLVTVPCHGRLRLCVESTTVS